MKQWFKENKVRLLVSSVVTLLPILYGVYFWDQLPASFVTHWGADGVADGTGSKAFAVFGMPLIFFAVNLLCFFCTYFDKNNREKNKKAMGIILYVFPLLSVLISLIVYKTAMSDSNSFEFFWLFPVIFGALFLVLGNYMPKVSQNRTLGFKTKLTLSNEENWNKTHRLVGRLWVIGGFVLLATAFLPIKWFIAVLMVAIVGMIAVPYAYSYNIYRNHKQQGISYEMKPNSKSEKAAMRITAITLPLVLVFVAALMFTGSIQYEFSESSLKISATYGDFSNVGYEFIDSVEYREDFDFGSRNYGFGSAKLSLGNFRNAEFGSYTLYAYTQCDSAVVIKSGEHILVINDKSEEATIALYNTLKDKID